MSKNFEKKIDIFLEKMVKPAEYIDVNQLAKTAVFLPLIVLWGYVRQQNLPEETPQKKAQSTYNTIVRHNGLLGVAPPKYSDACSLVSDKKFTDILEAIKAEEGKNKKVVSMEAVECLRDDTRHTFVSFVSHGGGNCNIHYDLLDDKNNRMNRYSTGGCA